MNIIKAKNLHLHPEQMTTQNGLATPTLKIKRYEVRTFFKNTIDGLYREGPL